MLSSLLLAATLAGQCGPRGCPAPARYNYAPAAVAAPAVYSLADASGRVWTHADYAYLQSYVARVNESLAPAPAPPPAPAPAPAPRRPLVVVPPSPYVKPAVPVVSAAPPAGEACDCVCRRGVAAAPPAAGVDFRFQ